MTVAAAAPLVHRFAARAMGSPLRLTLVGCDDLRAASIWAAVRDDVEATEQALSRFRESAELVALNRRLGAPVSVGDRLYRALAAAERARRLTDGRFDARVLRDLERLGEHGAAVEEDRHSAHEPAAGPSVVRRPRSRLVQLEDPIDLGGIGKGLALRWAGRVVERLEPGCGYLLEAGGDLVCRGPAPDGPAWRIAIEPPDAGPVPAAVIAARGGAVMTSSRLVRHWRDLAGREVHHLIDPATHEPAGDGLVSVTVAGPDPAWSEVWSKSLFVAGPRGVAALARSRGLAAWWTDADGGLAMTPAARERTLWVRGEA